MGRPSVWPDQKLRGEIIGLPGKTGGGGVPSRSHSPHNRLRLNAALQSLGEEHRHQSAPDHAEIRRGTYRIPYRKTHGKLVIKRLVAIFKTECFHLHIILIFLFPGYENRHEFIKCANKIIHHMATRNTPWCTCGS